MTIDQLMHMLAVRRHPDYPWTLANNHWWVSTQTYRFERVAKYLKQGEIECMVCDQLISPYNNDTRDEHAMQHAKEHGLLTLL
jgi:hypothetical protein